MDLNLGNDCWLEPLKDDSNHQTPRYKQINSPRIVVQNGNLSNSLHRLPSASSRQNVSNSVPSTIRQNVILSQSTPRNSAHSSIRSSKRNEYFTSSKPILRHNSSVRSQKLVGSNHWRPSTYEAIKSDHFKSGRLYEDPVFPADDSSLYRHTKLHIKNIKWKRPHEIVKNPKFIVNDVCNLDIEPGKLGDCWLVSAFTCLSMAPKLLKKCIPSEQDFQENYAGIFHFRFWRYGEWIDVVVDDRLPTVDGHILYMRSSDPQEFWPCLFEKAYAKLYGSYEHIHGGRVRWALQDITGGITNSHSISESSRHVLTVIDLAMTRASLIGAYISTSLTGNVPGVLNNGLKSGHTYRITGYAEIPVTGGKIILLRLKNPFHNVFWNGAWSAQSPHWKALTDNTREKMRINDMPHGEFWISFVDFKTNFTDVEICHLGPESWKSEPSIQHRGVWAASVAHRQWRQGFNAGGCVNPCVMCNNSQFYVELDKNMAIIVSLMQKYKTTDDQRRFQSCSCLIYKVPTGIETRLGADFFLQNKVYASTKFLQDRENVHTFVLPEGSYMIMPVTEVEGQEGRYMLRFYTAGNGIIRELDDKDSMVIVYDEHAVDPDRLNILRRQYRDIAGYNKYEEIDAVGLQKILATSSKEKIPFLCCVSGPDVINFKSLNLSMDTCKAAITIFDKNVDGHLSYSDFNKLLSRLISWQNIFRKFAKGNPDFSSYSLRNALKFAGFHVSNKTLEALVVRFTNHGRITLEEFICIVIKLRVVHVRHNQYPAHAKEESNTLLSELLRTTIYS